MTEYEGGCVERVNHFLKVFAFAKTIAEGEDVDDATKEILEAAAITHDIGIRVCFEKYGNCNGPHQEVEGPPIALEMLPACGYTHGHIKNTPRSSLPMNGALKTISVFSLRQDPCKAGLMQQAEQGICKQTLCS